MYVQGQGVPQDYVQAHMWFNLSTARGYEGARRNRDIAAGRITPNQLAEAQRLAREWRPKQQVAATTPSPRTEAPTKRPLEKSSTGSGFYVTHQGHILTNEHVVNGCAEVRIPPSLPVEIVARDEASDLALLRRSSGMTGAPAKLRGGRGIRPGDDVVVLGYPLHGLLASEANVTSGTVSALAGPGDDRRLFQITAPVQLGNSGGPVLDLAGNAVGVVMSKLDVVRFADVTGNIPQNVNFAIASGTARTFLDVYDIPYETAPSTAKLETADVAAMARAFTVLVECWN